MLVCLLIVMLLLCIGGPLFVGHIFYWIEKFQTNDELLILVILFTIPVFPVFGTIYVVKIFKKYFKDFKDLKRMFSK